MSAAPRVVFTRFPAWDAARLSPWMSHLQRLTGDDTDPDLVFQDWVGEAVVWQLVSANNRQLARSARIYPALRDAVAEARQVSAMATELEVRFVGEAAPGRFGWIARHGHSDVMTCPRWYATHRERAHSIQLAVRCLGLADLDPDARVIPPAQSDPFPELAPVLPKDDDAQRPQRALLLVPVGSRPAAPGLDALS